MAHDPALAQDLWRLMMQSAMSQVGRASSILQQLGLTPGHMKAILSLRPGEPRPIGTLAQGFGCDASTMTWLVDRLEERGLVERRPDKTDRRVKAVALTPQGVRMKKKLEARMFEVPESIAGLKPDVLEQVRDALALAMSRAAENSSMASAAH
ncbi:MAG: MarR family winged helix-turn-helix transcriptional regulator [Actinomycetota bacterium]|nr:MarR family transcriptional regulator [Actinomycetota bacterium]